MQKLSDIKQVFLFFATVDWFISVLLISILIVIENRTTNQVFSRKKLGRSVLVVALALSLTHLHTQNNLEWFVKQLKLNEKSGAVEDWKKRLGAGQPIC